MERNVASGLLVGIVTPRFGGLSQVVEVEPRFGRVTVRLKYKVDGASMGMAEYRTTGGHEIMFAAQFAE